MNLNRTTVGLSGCVTSEDFDYTILYIYHIDSLHIKYNSFIFV